MAAAYEFVYMPTVGSTQDEVRSRINSAPVVVAARQQSVGRGRRGAAWQNADVAMALSIGIDLDWRPDQLPAVTLMAGVVVADALTEYGGIGLKWPNDIMRGGVKLGGILTESESGSPTTVVIGIGLNLQWATPPRGMAAVGGDWTDEDWTDLAHAIAGGVIEAAAHPWPRTRYMELCGTLGREITWQPDGSGRAVDIDDAGGLVVETSSGLVTVRSGTVWSVG